MHAGLSQWLCVQDNSRNACQLQLFLMPHGPTVRASALLESPPLPCAKAICKACLSRSDRSYACAECTPALIANVVRVAQLLLSNALLMIVDVLAMQRPAARPDLTEQAL